MRVAQVAPFDEIEQRILMIRGHRVLIDSDLASLYSVDTKGAHTRSETKP